MAHLILYNGSQRAIGYEHGRDLTMDLSTTALIKSSPVGRQYAQESFEESLGRLTRLPSLDSIYWDIEKCREAKNLANARHIYTHVCANGFEDSEILRHQLIPMFVDCGSMPDAESAFLVLLGLNDCSLRLLLQGYVELGQCLHAIDLFWRMRKSVFPENQTYILLLKACASIGRQELSQEIHNDIAKEGLEGDPFVGHTLIDTYGKCGLIAEACDVFDNLVVRSVVSWTALMGVYVEHAHDEEALTCLEQLQREGLSENVITFVFGLKACGSLKAIGRGRGMHMEIVKRGFELDSFAGNTLVDTYLKCGLFEEAWQVFEKLPARDVFSWTALIGGCAEHGLINEALDCLSQMQVEGVFPNAVTFKCSLKACSKEHNAHKGKMVHMEVAKRGLDHGSVGNTILDMYSKCGSLSEAQAMFDCIPVRDVVSWNVLIAGYAEHGFREEAFSCLWKMHMEGISPATSTLLCCLKACTGQKDLSQGLELHDMIAKKGYLEDSCMRSALVAMYAKCGSLPEARDLFDDLDSQDIVLWSAMIAAHANEEEINVSLSLYSKMQEQGLCPNVVTFVSTLKACGIAASLEIGRRIHAQALCVKSLELCEVSLETAVMDMYIKCGSMVEARIVFEETAEANLVRWSVLITGYAHHGQLENAFDQLDSVMKEEGMQADEALLLSVLTACNHAGLGDKGLECFTAATSQRNRTALTVKHFNCLLDLMSKLGHLDEAMAILEEMPLLPDLTTWSTLLNACKQWGNRVIGRFAYEKMIDGIKKGSTAYVLMSTCELMVA